MAVWYNKVSRDLAEIPNFIEFYEREYEKARHELNLHTKTIERHSTELPGVIELRYSQLQEIESVLEYLNIELRKLRSQVFRKYLENYQRSLTSRDCEKYVDGDDSVVDLTLLTNEVALLRNKFLSVHKGLENKAWMISHIVKLRAAGLEDIVIR